MLFDLQSRRRRGVVKVIYTFLAILMGAGFILFGVGTGAGLGGFFDLFNNNGTSTKNQVSALERRAVRETRLHPQDPKAWAELTRARYQGAEYDNTNQTFTDAGRAKLQQAATAWQRYVALDSKPDPTIARLMATAYSETGLNEPAQAASALEIVTAVQPTSANFGALAQYAYLANETRKGNLAAAKAVALAPKAQQAAVKRQLANVRRQILQRQVQQAVQSAGTTTAPAPAKTKQK